METIKNCRAPWEWIQVLSNGDVRPCCFSSQKLGNLHQETLQEIWNGKIAQELREYIKRDQIHPICDGAPCQFFQNSSLLNAHPSGFDIPDCWNPNFVTNAELKLLAGHVDYPRNQVILKIELKNTGETLWRANHPLNLAYVTIALRSGELDSSSFSEARERQRLPLPFLPTQSIELSLNFTLPEALSLN